MLGIVHEIQKK